MFLTFNQWRFVLTVVKIYMNWNKHEFHGFVKLNVEQKSLPLASFSNSRFHLFISNLDFKPKVIKSITLTLITVKSEHSFHQTVSTVFYGV